MSRHRPFLFLYSLLIFFLIAFHGVDSSYSSACSDIVCNGVRISYPFFWEGDERGNGTTNVYCGYQGLGLTCPDGNKTFPILALPTDSYYVKEIDYHNESLTLVDIDASNQSCPRVRHNVSLEELPLAYISEGSMNLSFYFNCTLNPYSNPALPSPILCLEEREPANSNYSYVFLEGTEPKEFDWIHECGDKVVATVKQSELPAEYLNVAFGAAMNAGFVLDWEAAKNCSKCEQSGGRCGFNNRTKDSVCFCKNSAILTDGKTCPAGRQLMLKFIIAGGSLIASVLLFSMGVFCFCFCKRRPLPLILKGQSKSQLDIETFIKHHGSLAPKRFSYSEIKKMTSSFKIKLGQGGFGAVYKGKLLDGTSVAIKLLNSSKGNGEEFINEVASISRTSHVNIVTLLGFCFEGRKKALIYEYMSNRSLDKFIYDDQNAATTGSKLGIERLYNIAIGIARGLEYLHRGCNTRILHFDIKPHNILLDEGFCPKISDFGLSKLCRKNESIVSMLVARGTIGYIAPEVFSRNFGGISHKSDVYSYGMMLIEMVGGRNKFNVEETQSTELYFPEQIYRLMERGRDLGLNGSITAEENEIARKMLLVGLWCIQTVPSQRPTMSKVIELLEGSTEALKVPPKPVFISPARSPEESFSSSVLLREN